MKGIGRRDYFVSAQGWAVSSSPRRLGSRRCLIAKFPSQLEQAFVGFGSAIAKEHPSRGDMIDDALGQSALGLIIIEVRNVDQPLGLVGQGLGNLGVSVA